MVTPSPQTGGRRGAFVGGLAGAALGAATGAVVGGDAPGQAQTALIFTFVWQGALVGATIGGLERIGSVIERAIRSDGTEK